MEGKKALGVSHTLGPRGRAAPSRPQGTTGLGGSLSGVGDTAPGVHSSPGDKSFHDGDGDGEDAKAAAQHQCSGLAASPARTAFSGRWLSNQKTVTQRRSTRSPWNEILQEQNLDKDST